MNGRGLSSLCFSLYNIPVPKDCQLKNWKQRKELPLRLQKYAAKDACYSYYAYADLNISPDLTKPPSQSEMNGGMKVYIAPYLSSSHSIFNNGWVPCSDWDNCTRHTEMASAREFGCTYGSGRWSLPRSCSC
jgi:hypothetical protein